MTRRPPFTAAALLWLSLAVLTAVSLGWVGIAVLRGAGLSHESGVITGLAMDAAAGQFYPPLIGPGGYGGTRYGPGHILLQAGLIRLGMHPVPAGLLLTLAAAAALWGGMYRLLLLLAVPRPAAAAVPLLLLACPATRDALICIRPDVVPAALNVWGLACAVAAVQSERKRPGLWAGAVALFAAALLVKVTAGFGLLAAAALLATRRRPWRGVLVLAVTGLVVGAGMWACNAASDGRLWENFRACADPGGRPPVHLRDWLAILREVLVTDDWPGTLLVLLAVAAWLAGPRSLRLGPAGLYLLVTLAITLPMYFTPGLSANHLIDLHVAAVLVIGTFLGGFMGTARPPAAWGWPAATAIIVLLSLGQLCQRVNLARALFRRTDAFRRSVASAGPGAVHGVIFSDNAMVPVAVGQRPFLLDDFMFPAVRHARPDAQADLYRRLDDRFFAAIVLRYDPDQGDRAWVFGPRFAAELHAHYTLVGHTAMWDKLWVYRPKAR